MNNSLYFENLFKLDFMNENMEYDPHELFLFDMTESAEEEEILTEATNVTKGNLFKKIKGIIKKIWKWIRKKVDKLVTGIKKLRGTKKKGTSDINQIALATVGAAVGVGAIGKAAYNSYNSKNKDTSVTDDTLDSLAKDTLSGGEVGKYRLSISYDSGDLIKFNILTNSLKNSVSSDGQHHAKRSGESISILFKCINKPSILNELISFMEEIVNKKNVDVDLKNAKKVVNNAIAKVPLGDSYSTTMAEWISFNEKVVKLGKLIETWDDFNIEITQNGKPMNNDWIDLFNKVAQFSSFLSYGLNIISDSMTQTYDLSPEYHDSIKDIETLSKFVNGCIESNVPGKYIHKAVKEITDVSINCKKDDTTKKNMDWSKLPGQGRFILFSKNSKEIIKIGYTEYGIRSNIIENNIYSSISKIPSVRKKLCPILKMSKNNVVQVCQRAKVIKVSTSEASKVREEINSELKKHNSPFMIVDVNPDGFGYLGDDLVVTDYGQVRRVAKS